MNFSKTLEIIFSKIIQYLFPILCVFIVLGFYLKTYDSCQIKITTVQITGIIMLALWLIKTLENQNTLKFIQKNLSNKLFIPISLFVISGVLSYFLSPFKPTSFEEIIKRLIYVSTFFIIVFEFDSLKKIERLIFFILFASFISSLYGIIQYVQLDPFPWKGAFGSRIFSTFGNPNFLAAYLVWTTPIILAYIFFTKKWIYSILAFVSIFCVYATQSKASWIGLTFALVLFTFLSIKYFSHFKKEHYKKIMILFVIIFLICSSVGVWILINKRVDSVKFRVSTWHATWDMITKPIFVSKLHSTILGTGIGTFRIVYPAYRRPEIFHIEGKHNTETDHPENEFLEVLYDEGILGFGIFIWMLFLIYLCSFYKISYVSKVVDSMQKKNLNDSQKEDIALQHYLVGLVCGLSGLLVHNTMCVNMRFVSSGFFFWIILGLIVSIIKLYDKRITNINANIEPFKKFNYSVITKKILSIIVVILAIISIRWSINLMKADYYHNLGISYSKVENWNEAIKSYAKTSEYNKYFTMAYYFRGNVFLDRWNMEKTYNKDWGDVNNIPRTDAERAMEMYDKVKKISPNYVQTHFQVGMIYFKLKNYPKAIENFEKYLKIDPIFVHTYLQLGSIYVDQKNWLKAERIYKKALTENPNSYLVYFYIGNMFYFKNELVNAKQSFIKSISLNSEYIQSYKNLIFLYIQDKDYKNARLMAQKVLEISPNDEYSRNLLNQING